MATYYKAGTKVLTLNSKLLIPTTAITGGTVVYTDNFDSYAYNNYLGGYGFWIRGLQDLVVYQVAGGTDYGVGAGYGGYAACIYNRTMSADQYSQMKFAASDFTGTGIGVGVRFSGLDATFCGYGLLLNDKYNNNGIVRYDNGVPTQLGSAGTTNPSVGDIYKLKIVGSVLTAYKNGAVFTEVGTGGSYTDSTYATGKTGLTMWDNGGAVMDLWECGGNIVPMIYTDIFDFYVGNNYLAGLGNWIQGLNDMACWIISAGQNQVGPYSSGADCIAIYNSTLAANQYAQIKRTKVLGGAYLGIGVRLSGLGATLCGYGLALADYTNDGVIVRYDNGVATALGSRSTTNPSVGDIYKLKIVGSVLTAYKNGAVFTEVGTGGSYTDSTYATGKAGIVGWGTANDTLGDLWEAGEL